MPLTSPAVDSTLQHSSSCSTLTVMSAGYFTMPWCPATVFKVWNKYSLMRLIVNVKRKFTVIPMWQTTICVNADLLRDLNLRYRNYLHHKLIISAHETEIPLRWTFNTSKKKWINKRTWLYTGECTNKVNDFPPPLCALITTIYRTLISSNYWQLYNMQLCHYFLQ
jgi:hypothetical protein